MAKLMVEARFAAILDGIPDNETIDGMAVTIFTPEMYNVDHTMEGRHSECFFACVSLLMDIAKEGNLPFRGHMVSKKRADGSDALAVNACMPDHHVASTRTSREILEQAGINLRELHIKLWNGFMHDQEIAASIKTQGAFELVCAFAGLRTPAPTKRKANFR